MKDYHCLYVGLIDNRPVDCFYPGMDNVDACCCGYDKCEQYEKGSRKIKKEINEDN